MIKQNLKNEFKHFIENSIKCCSISKIFLESDEKLIFIELNKKYFVCLYILHLDYQGVYI